MTYVTPDKGVVTVVNRVTTHGVQGLSVFTLVGLSVDTSKIMSRIICM